MASEVVHTAHVWMPHLARQHPLELEPLDGRVGAPRVSERLDRHRDGQLLVPRLVHLARASGAEEPMDDVTSRHAVADGEARRPGTREFVQPMRGQLVHDRRSEQRQYFGTKRLIVGASRDDEVGAEGFGSRERVLDDLLDALPALGVQSVPASSRPSHRLSSIQSRFTVPEETSSTTAVSSMVMPPKKRHSTTRA